MSSLSHMRGMEFFIRNRGAGRESSPGAANLTGRVATNDCSSITSLNTKVGILPLSAFDPERTNAMCGCGWPDGKVLGRRCITELLPRPMKIVSGITLL